MDTGPAVRPRRHDQSHPLPRSSALIIGCTGDPPAAPLSSSTASLPPPSASQPVPSESVTEEERTKLEEALGTYQPAESDPTTIARLCMCRCGWRTPLPMNITMGIVNTLWPLFHYLLWQDTASKDTSQETHYAAYAVANQAFAERIKSVEAGRPHLHPLISIPPPLTSSSSPVCSASRRARLARHRPLCAHVTRRSRAVRCEVVV
ncbi:hypothetical protein B0H16DRAFT_512357 [Mycena metata]|uniref:Uncharacterized protein n=1 Tax=Mycena metata TaxID=1033252 RepID=A0AAD7H899_9AGAR|nr:hypothetical protein B0H16DRAFT_512357 [Mycena metata]